MTIDGLAPFLFLKNPNNLPISINMPPLEDSKDLFYFLTDVLFKGLYFLITNDYAICNLVNLSDVSIETFFVAVRKMRNMKVQVNLDVVGYVFDKSKARSIHHDSMRAVKGLPNNLRLEEYSLELPLHDSIYKISYTMLMD